MTVSLCIRQESKRNDDSVSVEELDWSNPRNTSGVTLNETKSSPNTNDLTYGCRSFIHFKTVAIEVEIQCLSTLIMFPFVATVCKCFSLLKKGWCQYFCPYNECTSISVGDEFVSFKVTPEVFSCFLQTVKFFHTDWIIISLWFLSYTQRHCHVRIEKSPNCWDIQLDSHRISLYALNIKIYTHEDY